MENQDRLLEEYRLAQEYVLATHERIWQIGAILIAASLGAFAIIASQQSVSVSSLIASVFGGLVSTSLLAIWFFIRERFASFIQVSYYRMREIEGELGLWRNRYIDYLDHPTQVQMAALSDADKQRFENLSQAFRNKYPRFRARTLERLLTIMVSLVWLCWIVYQAIVLFTI